MKVPAFVLDPRSSPCSPFTEEDLAAGKDCYISIDEVEPGSELAQAVVRLESENQGLFGAPDRLSQIAAWLKVTLP
jgi:hypothetical protein